MSNKLKTLETRVARLVSDRDQLTQAIHDQTVSLVRINKELQGTNDHPGLLMKLKALQIHQAWIDAEPERAAMRQKPEWQEWRRNLFARMKTQRKSK